jgi:hypothetical protein
VWPWRPGLWGGLVGTCCPCAGLSGRGGLAQAGKRCRGEVGRRAGTWREHGLVLAVLPRGRPSQPSQAQTERRLVRWPGVL